MTEVDARGVHHVAFRCRDAAQTHDFYTRVLGLKSAGALVIDGIPGSGHETPYMHIFFDAGHGNHIAFFDSPDDATAEWFGIKDSFDMHVAIEVDDATALEAVRQRIKAEGVRVSPALDHDFVESIYLYDPNGIQVEFTVRTPEHDAILAHEEEKLPETMRAWSEQTRAKKLALFGAEALDARAGRTA